jgi:hypothetical protein
MKKPCDEMERMTESWLDAVESGEPNSEQLQKAAIQHALNCAQCEEAFSQDIVVVMEIIVTGQLNSA